MAGSALAMAVLLLTAVGAEGRPAPPPIATAGLSNQPVPGGTAALARFAGVDADTPRGFVILQIIRAVHEAPVGTSSSADQRFGRFRTYLADLAAFLRARDALPDGSISASLAVSPASRRAVADLAAAIGGALDERGGGCRFVPGGDEASRRRRENVEAAGLDVAALEREFNGGSTFTLAIPADDVPLPLGPEAWNRIVASAAPSSGNLLTAILGDRRASLLYYGLMTLDAQTLDYVAAHEALIGRLMEGNRPAILAALGRSIRVRGSQVDVPGHPAATAVWEGLLQRSTAEPGAFILELLDRDRGRVALLYDAIDHLDAPRQAFALASRVADPDERVERLREMVAASAPSLAGWAPEARPFRRVSYDPVHLLTMTHVLESGGLPAPAGRRFWSAVLSGSELPDEPARLLERAAESDTDADAAWLVGQLCVADGARREQRLRTWLFGQRVFAGVEPAALPHVLVTLRGFTRFPMLLLTLERLGVADPELYASAARHAQQLREIYDRDVATNSMRQFQAALAILDRLRYSRAVSEASALRLVRALIDVPLADRGDYQGGLAAWLDTQLLPAITPGAAESGELAGTGKPLEAALLAAAAGVSEGASLPEIEWEGLRYRIDVAGAELRRMVLVRRKQGGYSLDDAIGLSRASVRLGSANASPDELRTSVASLASSVNALLAHPASGEESRWGSGDLRALLRTILEELRGVQSRKDPARLTRVRLPLQRAGDLLLASVLTSIAYAPYLGDPDRPELLAGDPADRHSYGFEERIPEVRDVNPWKMPQRAVGVAGGWRMTGSILGLDVGLDRLALRRLETDGLPPPPTGNDIDRAALAATVALISPFATSDAGRDALADAARRGRTQSQGLAERPAAVGEVIRRARLDEWRRQALTWALANEPERVPEYFSLVDLVRMGQAEVTPGLSLDAWGAASLDSEGCLCLRVPRPGMLETLAGRLGTSLVAEQFGDLSIRVAEELAGRALPAGLARAVMALAAQDVLDTYRPAYIDDWTALVAAVRRLTESRFVDYVSALTSDGPLVPDDRESPADDRR